MFQLFQPPVRGISTDTHDLQLGITLSPDGTRVAVRVQGDDPRVAIYDLTRDINNRLTFESDNVGVESPTWTPDGTHVAFGAPLSWKRADGTGDLETLSDDPERFPQAFSLDGGTLVFADRLGDGGSGLGVLTLEDGISTPLSCALGFSWTLACERVLAGGVSR